MCEGPTEPSDTSGGHSSALKHTTTTTTTKLDLKGDGHGESKQSQGHGMRSSEAAVSEKGWACTRKKERQETRRESKNYRLERGLLGKMFLLDKPFIIFIARVQDRQEERNTIRSERITV